MTSKRLDVDPHTAAESLRAALAEVGIVLPSLRRDPASPQLRLIELGRVRRRGQPTGASTASKKAASDAARGTTAVVPTATTRSCFLDLRG
ncbi:hypothetical protein DVH02_15490 [Streptomyces corynorhini]|uniref:Uncharacterized protein n=1 Tax=Streptomyces corynorhini TaxID=2282652 RepID=A0A370B613_9ACTN|nr:hypothetical protein DVH02_15490 [Streptomyces corynorhini]